MASLWLSKITAIDLNYSKTSKAGKPYKVARMDYTRPQSEDPSKALFDEVFHQVLVDNPELGSHSR